MEPCSADDVQFQTSSNRNRINFTFVEKIREIWMGTFTKIKGNPGIRRKYDFIYLINKKFREFSKGK
jgi:hypothetical protein